MDVFHNPKHPYTQALLRAIPLPIPNAAAVHGLEGSVPNAADPPPGCPFHTRCFHPARNERCRTELPPLRPVGATMAACHYAESTPTAAPVPTGTV